MDEILKHLENAENHLKQAKLDLQKTQELFQKYGDDQVKEIMNHMESLISETIQIETTIREEKQSLLKILLEFLLILGVKKYDAEGKSYIEFFPSGNYHSGSNFQVYDSLEKISIFYHTSCGYNFNATKVTFSEAMRLLEKSRIENRHSCHSTASEPALGNILFWARLSIENLLKEYPKKIKKMIDSRTYLFEKFDELREKILSVSI